MQLQLCADMFSFPRKFNASQTDVNILLHSECSKSNDNIHKPKF